MHISEALKANYSLTVLDLLANSIGDTGAQYISDSLKANDSLICLMLQRTLSSFQTFSLSLQAIELGTQEQGIFQRHSYQIPHSLCWISGVVIFLSNLNFFGVYLF
eukprot:TRINITY_DN1242_c0_g1_i2.p1 TRINITY_DN1242_c0_g1~~TRINITY_DN1242_c0_g1_i2.p1  ORF type:complete len:106 (-),score=8.36 TRINITY_DN1242_c0_g1_i2:1336-1653(-)